MKHNLLTQFLIDKGVLKDPLLIKAFDAIDRRDFLPSSQADRYLENRPIPIGYEQTNSQPFTVAFMLELLLPRPDEKILDVGSGSGWTAALIGATGANVIGVERIPELVGFARSNLDKYEQNNVEILHTPDKLGWEDGAPYQKIIVSAGIDMIPETLLEQLADDGRMVIPIGQGIQLVEKTSSGLKITNFDGFSFVPLVVV